MIRASFVVQVLKKALREKGVTYARIGRALGLSVSSVKRILAQGDLSLGRLEQICGLIEFDVEDLLERVHAAQTRVAELTEAQERELVSDTRLLLVGILATSYWKYSDMLEAYRFTAAQLTGLLAKLDRLGIIELHPGNRFKVRLARNFAWRKAGPIQHFFETRVQHEFFATPFLGVGELRLMLHGSLSARSNRLLQQQLRRVAEEFDALVEQDRSLARAEREGTTLVMALRPWELALFTGLRRK
jgi:transcriptional regulator with XRE-family HTH domain